MQRLGDDRYDELRRRHMRALRNQVAASAGELVKSEGDAIMAVFESAVDAVACAVGMQQAIHQEHQQRDESEWLPLRVGMDIGEPIREGHDYHGTCVVVAHRLADDANGGQILATQFVRRLVGTRGDFAFRDLEPCVLQGITEAVPVCEVLWEPASEPSDDSPGSPLAELSPPAPLVVRRPQVFVDRSSELAELERCWKESPPAGCRLSLVSGPAGIGKSSLASEFAARLHQLGAIVLAGRCVQDSPVRIQPFFDAFKPLREAPERLNAKERQLVEAFDSESSDLAKLSAAVASLIELLARERPLLVVLDDLHRAGADSLSLLKHLLYSLEDAPVMVLATYAADEIGRTHPLSSLLNELRRDVPMSDVSLQGFSLDDVRLLVSALAARDCGSDLAAAIWNHTEGNPLFVEEVYCYLDATNALVERDGHLMAKTRTPLAVPESVRDLIERRLSRLSEECNSLLNIAAVVGKEFDLDSLERASDLPFDHLLDLLEEAQGADVVREMAEAVGRYEFSHSLTYHTIYDELTNTRRVRLHGQTLRYADNDGVKLAYEVLGRRGPYVVAVGVSNGPAGRPRHRVIAEHWDRLAKDCRLILYDRRGVGSSAAPGRGYSLFTAVTDLEAVLDAVGASRVVLWGAVDGGPLAIQYAVAHPERVAGLVLLSTSPKLTNEDGFDLGVNPAVIQSFATMGATDRDRVTETALQGRVEQGGSQAAVVEIMHRVPEHAWSRLMAGAYGGDVRGQLADLHMPTLIVHDPDDDYIPVGAAHFLHEQISGSELEISRDYATLPLQEAGYQRIAAFIDQAARRGVL